MKTLRMFSISILSCTLLALAGCNGSGGNSGNAALNLYVADTPVDNATSVKLTFTGVEVQGADASSMDMGMDMGMGMDMMNMSAPIEFDFSTPKTIDLMAHQSGDAALLLNGVSLPSGNYQWIRLKVDTTQSTITLSDGTVQPLSIPSSALNGLQLIGGFSVNDNSTASLTIDFDLRKSVTLASGSYLMNPVLRLIDNRQAGTLSGSVSNTFTIGGMPISNPACSPAVYIYSGTNVTPTDINPTSKVQPIATASVKLDNNTGDYAYSESLLPPGSYTLAMTCAANDNPASVDTLSFSSVKAATVTANQITTVNSL